MAVAYGTGASGVDTGLPTSITVNFNPGTGDNMVIVALHVVTRGAAYLSTGMVRDPATDNVAFTELIGDPDINPWDNFSTMTAAIYILKDADIDKGVAQDYKASSTAGGSRQILILASLTGVDQTTSTGTPVNSASTAASATYTPSGTADGVMFSFLGLDGPTDPVFNDLSADGTGQTLIAKHEQPANTCQAAVSYTVGNATPSLEWSWTNSEQYRHVSIDVLAAAAGTTIEIPTGPVR